MKAASHTPIRNLHCSMVTTLPYSDEHFTDRCRHHPRLQTKAN